MTTSYQYFVETEVPSEDIIISRTDLSGRITYANEVFAKISGYSVDELIGKPHSVVRHPDMPKSVFKELWETLKRDGKWNGYVKNLRKDKGYYWVYAEISGVYKDGELVEYKSLRSPIEKEVSILFQEKYDDMRKEEEGVCRVVCDISVKNYDKLKKFAQQSNMSIDKALDHFLEDDLL